MEHETIIKYLNHTASSEEVKDVEDWINSSEKNKEEFNRLKAEYIVSTFDETKYTSKVEEGYIQYRKNIAQSALGKRKKLWGNSLKYAAMLAIVFGCTYLYIDRNPYTPSPKVVLDCKKDKKADVITLKMENGTVQVIEENGLSEVKDSKGNMIGTQQGNKLKYSNKAPLNELTYNTLTVPYGKRFDLILSDGSHVVLNSGTSLRYPVKFIKDKNREVFLTGEAFFEVTKNKKQPFIVNTNGLNIKVLGTKFNVSAYPEDNSTNTVLVEGSVKLRHKDGNDRETSTLLTPGHLASLNKTDRKIMVENAETSIYTAWMNGDVIFRHLSFKNIIKKLERHYNVHITNKNPELDEELFTASFNNKTLDEVLKTFKDNYGIDYTIANNQVTINP
ncbi:FecR family protein [Zobellia uliginosa]|uniref:FecR family protein n=1 Tax=Zobellia uliginosa TaxID=143224 RepID=UPI0026E282EE|nr:FecR domain-containing protein [Zobellia uliginosa]MDO6517400.1 DUF4974 domain-containing protein [Zobellia uliginosa]